jgi:hypothetical protein
MTSSHPLPTQGAPFHGATPSRYPSNDNATSTPTLLARYASLAGVVSYHQNLDGLYFHDSEGTYRYSLVGRTIVLECMWGKSRGARAEVAHLGDFDQ